MGVAKSEVVEGCSATLQSVGNGPGGGTVNGKAQNCLQSQHADLTDLTTCLSIGIQQSLRIAVTARGHTPM